MVDRHWHWEIVAHDGSNEVGDKIHWAASVTVVGYEREADALIAAADILVREHYHVARVWECAACGFQQTTADNLKELVKAMK